MPKFELKRKFRNPPVGDSYSQTRSKEKRQGNELKERTDTTPIQHLENTGINSTEGDPDTEESIKFQMTSEQHYGHMLHKFDLCLAIEEDVRFVLLDYDEEKRRVKNQSYVFVTRRPHQVPDGFSWSLYCSCNRTRMEYVKSLPDIIMQPVDNVIQEQECLHIRAIEIFFGFYDIENNIDAEKTYCHVVSTKSSRPETSTDHAYHLPVIHDSYKEVPGGCSFLGVCPYGQDWGVCTFVYTKVTPPLPCVKCITCKQYECVHAICLKKALAGLRDDEEPSRLSEFKVMFETSPQMRKYSEASTCSEEKVPLFSERAEVGDSDILNTYREFKGKRYVMPSAFGACNQCGNNWSSDNAISEDWIETECVVAFMYSTGRVNVCFRPCSNCSHRKTYDGLEDGLLCFGKYALSHTVLKDYIRMFLLCNIPMHKYFMTYNLRQICAGNRAFPSLISYTKFRLGVIAMIRILDINYEEGFHCTLCGKFPDKVVLDGTALGIQKTFMPPEETQTSNENFDGSRFDTRNFVLMKACRELMKKFCLDGLSTEDFETLKALVSSPGLLALLVEFEKEGFTKTCPSLYIPLVKALASDQAVCAFIPPTKEVLDLMSALSKGLKPKEDPVIHMKILQEKVPVLFSLFASTDVPCSVLPLFEELAQKSVAPFLNEDGTARTAHCLPPIMDGTSGNNFPCLPKRVQRGIYRQDKERQQDDCEKVSFSKKRHKTLTHGLFTLSCVHGICYGFELMRNHESPNVPFTIIRTRFKKAPSIIVYDNACKLHRYSLNRDPGFFKDSKFLVDKFHWKNHKACSEGYNIGRYPEYSKLNSQAAEQLNSSLKPLASMLCYMDHDNFVLFTRLHIYYRNMLHKCKTVPEVNFSYKHVFADMCKLYCK